MFCSRCNAQIIDLDWHLRLDEIQDGKPVKGETRRFCNLDCLAGWA